MTKEKNKNPPKLAEWILSCVYPDRGHFTSVGDFREEYLEVYQSSGPFRANLWYWMQIAKSIPSYIRNRSHWSIVMIHNYLKIAFRTIKRHKGYSIINITGLALGMACCLMILMHLSFELSYDTYHKDVDRIYRIGIDITTPTFEMTSVQISFLMAPFLKDNFPQVESVTRIWPGRPRLIQKGDSIFYENNFIRADNNIFDVITIPFIHGNAKSALTQPGSLVITESMSRKYFGNENPFGTTLQVDGEELLITGVIADQPPNTHLKFEFIAPISMNEVPDYMQESWDVCNFFTYIKFRLNANLEETLRQIEAGANKNRNLGRNDKYTYFLQPIRDIHLHSHFTGELEPPGNPTYFLIFGVIAGLILAIASINFINLSTARAAIRAREVGMRKTVGAARSQLIVQFIGESMFTTLLAVILACVIVLVSLPLYSYLVEIPYTVSSLVHLDFTLVLVGIILFTGLVAGSYPAFFLSAFSPVTVLKGRGISGSKRNGLRRFMVVVQFTASLILVTGTIVIYHQIEYMKNKHLGFEKEQKVIIPVRGGTIIQRNPENVKSEFRQHSGILGATVSSGFPGGVRSFCNTRLGREASEEGRSMHFLFVDSDFLDEYGIELAAGRAFQKKTVLDKNYEIVINETALSKFGFHDPKEIFGKKINSCWRGQGEIVGVVKDFHFYGLQSEIGPMILINTDPSYFRYITLTLSTYEIGQTLSFIKKTWKEIFHDIPLDYFFLDTYFDRFYRHEEKVAALVSVFSILAISIACLGILGLASNTTQQRTKEIGIRKVLGASASRIVSLLTGEFVRWILFANIIAWPIAYYVLNRWLAGFAYRIEFSAWFLLIPCALSLGLAALTVSYHTIKAAVANPADSLRYE